MPNNNSVLAALIDELAVVSEHYVIDGRGDYTTVTAWVTADHTGADVHLTPGASNPHIESKRLPFTAALDDVLAKIALAAPQAIPA